MSQNFRLFLVSNLPVLNSRIFAAHVCGVSDWAMGPGIELTGRNGPAGAPIKVQFRLSRCDTKNAPFRRSYDR